MGEKLAISVHEHPEDIARLQRERDYAISWANQSVKMLQDAFFPLADALRALEAYLRDTPHHNALEAAAARKALAAFYNMETPIRPTSESMNRDGRG